MGFSSAQVASWPSFTLPGSSVTLRANADAGVVFVVGSQFSSSAGTATFAGVVLPAVFRPLASVYLVDIGNQVSLQVSPTGAVSVANEAASTSYFWRTFYLTTVNPG